LIGQNNKDRKITMLRGSKSGERRGGRQRGTPNKKTALRSAALAAAAANPDMTPLDFLLGIMRDPNVSSELRIRVAQAAAPFIHAKPGTARSTDPAACAKPIDAVCGFTIDPVLARALRDDYERSCDLLRKKMAPNEYGGPPTAAEEQEQAWLGARITKTAKAIGCPAGYGLKQAKKDKARLHRLYCQRISPPQCGGGALPEPEDAEEAQLTLYPDLPLDPDDPLKIEAWRRVDAKGKATASKLDRSKPRLSAVPRPFSDDDQP
jgi:hypothetical protein